MKFLNYLKHVILFVIVMERLNCEEIAKIFTTFDELINLKIHLNSLIDTYT